jgi:hypothetical protein
LELIIDDEIVSLYSGDTVVTTEGEYLIVSANGFDLQDNGICAEYILIDVKYGDMQGYLENLDEIWKFYNIKSVIPNYNSIERRKNNVR